MNDERFNLCAAKFRIKLQEHYEAGEERFCTLVQLMINAGRTDELLKTLNDPEYRYILYSEFGI